MDAKAPRASSPKRPAPPEPRTLRSRRAELLEGVAGEWLPLLDLEALDKALAAIDARGDGGRTSPTPELIFECLRYGGPADVRVVLVGQDPYPDPRDAMGLSFAVPRGRPCPPSLANIHRCLERAGLRPPGAAAAGDLRAWAVQGVLLLNAALTTRAGERGAHAAEWQWFVARLLEAIGDYAPGRRLHFLLWGGAARAHALLARRRAHEVHEWTHPSPLADNRLAAEARFRECPHFEAVNAALGAGRLCWDATAATFAFADGGCANNGRSGARAAWAVVLVGGQFGPGCATLCGSVAPAEYALLDEAAPERGLRRTARPAAPTNNRAELLAVAVALLALLRGRAAGRVELVTDSLITVRTLNEWLPHRRQAGTTAVLKNLDLVLIAARLLAALRLQAAEVVLEHVPGHRPAPLGASAQARLRAAGNEKADALAAAVLAGERAAGAPLEARGPAVLHTLAV